ncbi:hypothetical protein AO715_14450 [Xanthomonas sp. Mitacek01]|nr:hypothetical protein AO715_14450 [Xanthomonas sp. Mitacek01]
MSDKQDHTEDPVSHGTRNQKIRRSDLKACTKPRMLTEDEMEALRAKAQAWLDQAGIPAPTKDDGGSNT